MEVPDGVFELPRLVDRVRNEVRQSDLSPTTSAPRREMAAMSSTTCVFAWWSASTAWATHWCWSPHCRWSTLVFEMVHCGSAADARCTTDNMG
ncbi:hypothetical protein VI08_19460 [Luteibacter yeojuensis]|uniref:Uncharacterized protein n=1 Tax=Luteibacter yeojuensis TaxID=345309 RepID=A0A0F3K3M5_9GAMM|nr:hypothetical protein VI08_19460 [Luteibacter yeojuensis]